MQTHDSIELVKRFLDSRSKTNNKTIRLHEICPIGESKTLRIMPRVWTPRPNEYRHLGHYLYYNAKGLFWNRKVLDMGCGCGILGIIAGLLRARETVFADISPAAIENTIINLSRLGLSHGGCYVSDLFEAIPIQKFDTILFNHPYFRSSSVLDEPISAAITASPDLLRRFFRDCCSYLSQNGCIVMGYWSGVERGNCPMRAVRGTVFRANIAFEAPLSLHGICASFTIMEMTMHTKSRR